MTTGQQEVPSLRRNFAWALAGNAVYAACQWAIIVILAKLATPEAVGEFALGLALAAPIILFGNLQLRGIQATDARSRYRFRDYRDLRLAAMALSILAILGISLVAGYSRPVLLTVVIVAAAKAVEGISDVYFGLLQKHHRMDLVSRSMIFKGLASVLLVALALALWPSALAAAVALLASWLLVLLTYDSRAARALVGDESAVGDPAAFRSLFLLALPLGFVSMLVSLQSNIPRYLVEKNLGVASLGIYAAIASLLTAGTMFVTALGQSTAPRLAQLYTLPDARPFRSALLRYAALAAVLGLTAFVASALLGRPMLRILFGAAYASHLDLLLWLMAGSMAAYPAAIFGFGMTAAGRFRAQLPLALAMAAVTLGVGMAAIPSRGLVGAAWATGAAFLVQVAGAAWIALSGRET